MKPPRRNKSMRRELYRKISWRLIPYIFILYILAYLDRVNVGFAAVPFTRDLRT